MYNIQQIDLDILRQNNKDLYVKVELLNFNGSIVDELNGELIDGTIDIDASSRVRRTCSLVMYVKNKNFLVGYGKSIWLNKFVRIQIGINHARSQQTVWYKCGIYLFTSASYQYDAVTKTLTLSCADCMSVLTGLRNGQMSGQSFIIGAGFYIRDVLVSIITQLTPFKTYIIHDIQKTIPYDIQLSTGATVDEMITHITDLYPAWESFVDINGTFVCQSIPTMESDAVFIDEHTMKDLVIKEVTDYDLTEVKNSVEVWGKCLKADWFSESSTFNNNIYSVSIENFIPTASFTVAFKVNVKNNTSPQIQINGANRYPVIHENGDPIKTDTLKPDTFYVFQCKNSRYMLLGQFQINAIAKDTNRDSPFNIYDNDEVRLVLSGGEYDNIYSDDLAQQRADYELWKATRLNDRISLEMMAIYWLDVNQKIRYIPEITGVVGEYITKKISISIMAGTMNLEMIKFYPLYPNII